MIKNIVYPFFDAVFLPGGCWQVANTAPDYRREGF